jgi:hypothetical protein
MARFNSTTVSADGISATVGGDAEGKEVIDAFWTVLY